MYVWQGPIKNEPLHNSNRSGVNGKLAYRILFHLDRMTKPAKIPYNI